jgi:hypothetical protein
LTSYHIRLGDAITKSFEPASALREEKWLLVAPIAFRAAALNRRGAFPGAGGQWR